ncbi:MULTISPECIES: FAD-dependent monooxygenase [Catenuloplanes]|uniref:2-polyprenyl-6-methoxyphenol hydroxylase-like FAD-dependent oxidoreductase n=1 Tax=Catenuloplanes niger TaxID=587534 RepID=A0AAE4CT70_9ACTN|nr:FAD-dependent monooxygenase [Catenuloplanes niger]MDR7320429.1 2-polyprenyl-6-methoxyphenol hydroxylase-like FAD-dependent oxidoreductase [Catenuloplanes niger]
MERTQALIIGGGVAGAATALALHRAGIASAVFEAHRSGGDDAGAFLTVMANGMAALDSIGAAQAVIEASHPARAVALFDAAGRRLGERPIEGPARTMRRAALYRVLQEQVAAHGIPIHHGRRLTGATAGLDARATDGGTAAGVRAGFEDGGAAEGTFLVGADGIHSRVRGLIDPDAPRPRFTGRHVVYGYADGNPGDVPPDTYHMISGGRASFGCTAPGDGRTWWFARIPGAPGGGGATPAGWRELALAAFRDDATPAAAIIAATGAEVVGGDSYDIPTTPRWHDGRMVLTGDAAHAASPAAAQGASMALADAVALAAALTAHGDDLPAAFAAYELRRRAETEETVAASARLNAR